MYSINWIYSFLKHTWSLADYTEFASSSSMEENCHTFRIYTEAHIPTIIYTKYAGQTDHKLKKSVQHCIVTLTTQLKAAV